MLNTVISAAHAKMIVSLLQDLQENDQRVTMLQLADKLKVKQKGVGLSFVLNYLLY